MSSKNKYSVVINAGGFGTRLSTAYKGLPKALVPVFDKPIIIDQINKFVNQGFCQFIIILGYKAAEIIDCLEREYRDSIIVIKFLVEAEPLGSGGSILKFLQEVPSHFILTYCDILFDLNINNMVKFHEEKASDMTIFVHPNDHPYDSDLVSMDENKLVSAINPHPHSYEGYTGNLVNAAFYVVNKTSLGSVKFMERAMDFAQDIIPSVLVNSKVYAYQTPEFLKDMGTPTRLSNVRSIYKDRFLPNGHNKVICLDRDGTLNRCLSGQYIKSVDDFELFEGIGKALAILRNLGYFLVCVTNQPVIARGEIDLSSLHEIHLEMDWLLGVEGAYLDGVYFCPHHTDSGFEGEVIDFKFDCECRKPKTGLLDQIMGYIPFDPAASWFVGDSWRDINCGKVYGMKTCSIGDEELGADVTVATLIEFAKKLANGKFS